MREDASVSPAKPEPGRIGPSNVARAFDEHARSYDRLVGANRGYHEHLRMSARRMGLRDRGAGLRLLDLGCGTGASTAGAAGRRARGRDHRRRRVERDALDRAGPRRGRPA